MLPTLNEKRIDIQSAVDYLFTMSLDNHLIKT